MNVFANAVDMALDSYVRLSGPTTRGGPSWAAIVTMVGDVNRKTVRQEVSRMARTRSSRDRRRSTPRTAGLVLLESALPRFLVNLRTTLKLGLCRPHPKIQPHFLSSCLVCPSGVKLDVFVRQPNPVLVSKSARKPGAAHEDLTVPSPYRCPSRRARHPQGRATTVRSKPRKGSAMFVGIDVSKGIGSTWQSTGGKERWQFARNEKGISQLIEQLRGLPGPIELVVLEATGGLERDVAAALAVAKLPAAVVNPKRCETSPRPPAS